MKKLSQMSRLEEPQSKVPMKRRMTMRSELMLLFFWRQDDVGLKTRKLVEVRVHGWNLPPFLIFLHTLWTPPTSPNTHHLQELWRGMIQNEYTAKERSRGEAQKWWWRLNYSLPFSLQSTLSGMPTIWHLPEDSSPVKWTTQEKKSPYTGIRQRQMKTGSSETWLPTQSKEKCLIWWASITNGELSIHFSVSIS